MNDAGGPLNAFAERYHATLVPVIFQPWARELLRRLPPRDGDHILDLACGTGVVTAEIAASGVSPASLTGADYNAGMLSVAGKRAAEAGIRAKWVEADAGDLPFPDGRFDRAYCQQAFQFFPDRPGALRELRRVMAEGGEVAFCVQREIDVNPMLKAQAETLAIVAYLQPVARPEIARIRGVSSESAVNSLSERGLIEESGRSRFGAAIYRTSPLFEKVFGLEGLEALPDPTRFDPTPDDEREIRERLLAAGEQRAEA